MARWQWGHIIVLLNDYLPYCQKINDTCLLPGNNDYLYGGKELQKLFDIPWYDNGARFLTTTGIFTSIDPLAEHYYHISPYAYAACDPVNLVDIDGNIARWPAIDPFMFARTLEYYSHSRSIKNTRFFTTEG